MADAKPAEKKEYPEFPGQELSKRFALSFIDLSAFRFLCRADSLCRVLIFVFDFLSLFTDSQ